MAVQKDVEKQGTFSAVFSPECSRESPDTNLMTKWVKHVYVLKLNCLQQAYRPVWCEPLVLLVILVN